MRRRADGFLRAFTADLVDLELGPVPAELRDRTCGWVSDRVWGSGQLTRAGLGLVGAVLAAGVRTRTGKRYRDLPPERRHAIARRLLGTRLPLAGEYVKAVRSLAVAYVYDARYASAP